MARELNGEILIEASKERVWEALADFGNNYLWNPAVVHSHSTSEAPNGVGSTRHCDLTVPKASIEERVVDWVENEQMRIEIFDGRRKPPFKEALGNVTLANHLSKRLWETSHSKRPPMGGPPSPRCKFIMT